MSIAITSFAGRFSMNGVIFKDYINLDRVFSISLCKDRYYDRFDILFYFALGTRNSSFTDEQLLRVGPFPNKVLNKAEELIIRFNLEKDKVFNIDEELLDNNESPEKQQEAKEE